MAGQSCYYFFCYRIYYSLFFRFGGRGASGSSSSGYSAPGGRGRGGRGRGSSEAISSSSTAEKTEQSPAPKNDDTNQSSGSSTTALSEKKTKNQTEAVSETIHPEHPEGTVGDGNSGSSGQELGYHPRGHPSGRFPGRGSGGRFYRGGGTAAATSFPARGGRGGRAIRAPAVASFHNPFANNATTTNTNTTSNPDPSSTTTSFFGSSGTNTASNAFVSTPMLFGGRGASHSHSSGGGRGAPSAGRAGGNKVWVRPTESTTTTATAAAP